MPPTEISNPGRYFQPTNYLEKLPMRNRLLAAISTTWLLMSLPAAAQQPGFDTNPQLPANAVQKISEHVYAISGFPNIGIVVGKQAVLVIDTGLGPRNGKLIANEVRKLSPNTKLYLTTTHFHPEHASGEAGFPAGTVLIRNRVQQQELQQDDNRTVQLFARNPEFAPFLSGVTFRQPDILFDKDYRLDLGDVHVHLMWLGPAHTQGDQEMFVEEDRALFTGDIAMNGILPRNFIQGSSWQTWVNILDKLIELKPLYVLPDHGKFGDGSLLTLQRDYLSKLGADGNDAAPPTRE
jgi:glyoxylase-like metal-dependent hydrolase (beta-lactamase superfamily II)